MQSVEPNDLVFSVSDAGSGTDSALALWNRLRYAPAGRSKAELPGFPYFCNENSKFQGPQIQPVTPCFRSEKHPLAHPAILVCVNW